MFGWLQDNWKGIAVLAVAAVVFTVVTVATGGLGAPVMLSLAAGGFASGVAGYATGELLDGRTPTLQDALVQGTVSAALTVTTVGVGRVIAPVAAGLLAPVTRVIPAGLVVPEVVKVSVGNGVVGATFGTGVQAVQNVVRGRPVTEGLEDAAALGAIDGLLAAPASSLGQRLAHTFDAPPLPQQTVQAEPVATQPKVAEPPVETALPVRPVEIVDAYGRVVGAGGVEPLGAFSPESRTALDAWNVQIAQVRQVTPRVLTEAELLALAPGRAGPSKTVQKGGVDDRARFDAVAKKVNDLVASGEDLSIERLREINQMLLGGTPFDQYAGRIRSTADDWVYTVNENRVFQYADPELVPRHLEDFMTWYRANEGRLPPTELAAEAYQQLVRIHPFFDSNGRTTRFAMDWILQRNGLPPATFDGIPHRAVDMPTDWVVYNVDRAVLQASDTLTRTVDGSAVEGVTLTIPAPPASRTRGFTNALGGN